MLELLDAKLETSVARAAALLRAGELVAFPTDTVYGLAAAANQPDAITQLYIVKNRSPEKAIPILLANAQDLGTVVAEISDLVRELTAHLWPGGLTLVLPKSQSVPKEISTTTTVAVRIPDLPLTRQIIAAAGTPLAVTSANRSGQPSPRTPDKVISQLGGRIAAIVDGGPCPGGVPSTVLDCTTDPPRVLRAGAVPIETLLKFTPVV